MEEKNIWKVYNYMAIVDIPAFGIAKDHLYYANLLTDVQRSLVDNPAIFKKVEMEGALRKGATIVITGIVVDNKHPWLNKTQVHSGIQVNGRFVKQMMATIRNISTHSAFGWWEMEVIGQDGNQYTVYTHNINPDDPCGFADPVTIKRADIYWYINSQGNVCMTHAGKSKSADMFRKRCGNYFEVKLDAENTVYYINSDANFTIRKAINSLIPDTVD